VYVSYYSTIPPPPDKHCGQLSQSHITWRWGLGGEHFWAAMRTLYTWTKPGPLRLFAVWCEDVFSRLCRDLTRPNLYLVLGGRNGVVCPSRACSGTFYM